MLLTPDWSRALDAYALVPPITWEAPDAGGVNNTNLRVHTGAGDFFLRSYTSLGYDDPASISYEHRLLAWLAAKPLSFAVPVPIATRTGQLLTSGPQGLASLTPYLPGARLDAERPHHVELLGALTGELQAALREYPMAPRPGRALFSMLFDFPRLGDDSLALTPRDVGLSSRPSFDALFSWWREEVERLRTFVDGPYRRLPAQVCHNDVTHNNVLVERDRVAAVLDFEFATVTPRALDLTQGLRVTLRIRDNPDPFAAARRFFRGYNRWVSLTNEELHALPWLMRLRAAITVLWWIGRSTSATEIDQTSPVPDRIAMLRQTTDWAECHGDRLIEIASQETTP